MKYSLFVVSFFIAIIAINAQSSYEYLTEDAEKFEAELCAVYAPNNQEKCVEVVGKLRELYNDENESTVESENEDIDANDISVENLQRVKKRCKVCRFIIHEIEKAGNGQTKKGIERIIGHSCDLAPGPLKLVCKGIVKILSHVILKEIDKKVPLNQICDRYKPCRSGSEDSVVDFLTNNLESDGDYSE